jgi:hypothetical protein
MATLDSQLDPLRKQVVTLENKREALLSLLETEEREWAENGTQAAKATGPSTSVATPALQDVIKELLANGETWSASTIASFAVKKGCNFKGSNPNRSTHFTLVGLSKGGLVENAGYGKWRLARMKGITIAE